MSTKRFIAPTMREAMRLVRTSLGPDAIILTSNAHEKGVEVIASLSELNKTGSNIILDPNKSDSLITKPLDVHNMTARILLGATEARAKAKAPKEEVKKNQVQKAVQQQPNNSVEWIAEGQVLYEVRNELQSIRDFLSAQLSGLAWQEFKRMKPMQVSLLRRMLTLGIESNTAMKLLQKVDEGADLQVAWSEALSVLSSQLSLENVDLVELNEPIAVIGGSGVGKTLTLIKLAATLRIKKPNAKLIFLSSITDGVASNALLRGYSRLLQMPVILISNPEEYLHAVRLNQKDHYVFIDTPSLECGIHEKNFPWLNAPKKPRTWIVLPASGQYNVLNKTLEKSSILLPTGSIMTKVDETSSLGEGISVLLNSKLPLVFFTDGIKVPAHLQPPCLSVLMQKMLTGQLSTTQVEVAWMCQKFQVPL